MTKNQKIFADEYVIDRNGTRAYKVAYQRVKSDEVAKVNASRLLTNANVKEYIDGKMKLVAEKAELKAIDVINELKVIGFTNIKDFLSFRTEKVVVGYEDGEPIIDYRQIVDILNSNQVDGRAIQEISISKDGTLKFKLYDKQKALDSLGQYLGLFKQQIEVSGQINNPFAQLTTDELKKLINSG
jgi:phage terminase small subunit